MAASGNAFTIYESFKAGTNAKTTTSQFKVACIDTAGTLSVMLTSTSMPVGVINSYQDSNSEVVNVVVHGITLAECNDTITVGAPVCANENGKLIPFSGATASTQHILGYAREACAATGTVITVYVNPTYNAYVKI